MSHQPPPEPARPPPDRPQPFRPQPFRPPCFRSLPPTPLQLEPQPQPLLPLPPRPSRTYQPPMYRRSPLSEELPRARSAAPTTPHGRRITHDTIPDRTRFTPLAAVLSLCSSLALALWYMIRFCLRRRR